MEGKQKQPITRGGKKNSFKNQEHQQVKNYDTEKSVTVNAAKDLIASRVQIS